MSRNFLPLMVRRNPLLVSAEGCPKAPTVECHSFSSRHKQTRNFLCASLHEAGVCSCGWHPLRALLIFKPAAGNLACTSFLCALAVAENHKYHELPGAGSYWNSRLRKKTIRCSAEKSMHLLRRRR